ncbi:hypothetical protein EVAR_41427_1 [Eumeta japonica]|uniref:Uncharacterized protein n=1 Tax=Eumeta variegata TaxID=151549 RepID=A0A4C1W7C2_EUMVA|nr:hypothetical protein EVAR_41427_1 [Eumeta japonica]
MVDLLRKALVGRTVEGVMHSRLFNPEHFRLCQSECSGRRKNPEEEGEASETTRVAPRPALPARARALYGSFGKIMLLNN